MQQETGEPGISDEDRRHLIGLGRRSVVATGTVVCHEGDPTGDVFLIESGSVRVVRTALDGREVILATRRGGDLVGEMSAFDGRPRSAAVISNESTSLITIGRDAFRDAVSTRPPLAALFLHRLAHKLRAADELVLRRDTDDARTRIIGRLVTLADARSGPDVISSPDSIRVPVRQSDLAAWVGTSRETVARILGDLRAEQLVATGRGTIEILDLPTLRRSLG